MTRPTRRRADPLTGIAISCGLLVLAFIVLPLFHLLTAPSPARLAAAVGDPEVLRAIGLSLGTAAAAAAIAVVFGTPFAWLLARRSFPGKRLVEAAIDLPIVIPHPVVGIAILGITGRNHPLGALLYKAGIHLMGSITGIITVLTFVGLPFYLNTVREGFTAIPPRLEHVSRSLGAGPIRTFFRVTLPLAGRSIVVGIVMCAARAISEFGAVVVVAYHPMIAPVLIYERFEAYGLRYSQPVAVLLVGICLVLFIILRLLTGKKDRE
jgi:molybdate/tungstate transport system permease protein